VPTIERAAENPGLEIHTLARENSVEGERCQKSTHHPNKNKKKKKKEKKKTTRQQKKKTQTPSHKRKKKKKNKKINKKKKTHQQPTKTKEKKKKKKKKKEQKKKKKKKKKAPSQKGNLCVERARRTVGSFFISMTSLRDQKRGFINMERDRGSLVAREGSLRRRGTQGRRLPYNIV